MKKESNHPEQEAVNEVQETAQVLEGTVESTEKPVSVAKKIFGIVGAIFRWLVVLIAIFMMVFTVVSVSTFNRNDRSIFGLRAYIVNSDSMKATDFDAGDLILVHEVDPDTLQEGDVIAYISQNTENFGEIITHKIRRKTVDAQGNPAFVTYGTTTNTDDTTPVTYPYIMGKYSFNLPKLGHFFNFLKTPQGYFICIFIPFMILILYQGVKCVILFRRYKKEQNAELEEEKAQIEAERAENAKMMQELLALKAKLEGQGDTPQQQEPSAEETPADEGTAQ